MILQALWNHVGIRPRRRRRRATLGFPGAGTAAASAPPSQHVEELEDRALLSSVNPAALALEPAEQVIVFNQPATFPGAFNYWASSVDGTITVGAVTYDDFFFPETVEFENIAWQGLYEDADLLDNPADPNTGTWRLNVWADNGFGTGPGTTLLLSQDFAPANVNTQFVAFTTLGSGVQVPVFNFATNLLTPFTANANTIYWLSVLSISQGANNPIWGWMSGVGNDGASVQQFLGGTTDFVRTGDRAFRFIDLVGPSAPTLLNPVGTVGDVRPTFSWSAVADAARYDLWVNVFGTNEVVIRNANVSGTTFRPNFSLSADQTYIWTVRGITSTGIAGDFAQHAIFRIESELGAPTLIRPSGTVGLPPTFEWTAVANADHYDIWVNVFGSNAVVIRNTNVPSTTFTPSGQLAPGQTYIWTVRAVSSSGAPGDWAAHLTFRTIATAPAPTIIAPVGTIATTIPTFRWNPVAGATRYDVWVNVFGSNQFVFRNTNVAATSLVSPVTLTPGQTYIWTVRALVGGVPTAWADHRTFRVASANLGPDSSPLRPAIAGEEDEADELDVANGVENVEDRLTNASVAMLPETGSDSPNEVNAPQAADKIDEVMQEWARTDWWALAENRPRRDSSA